LIRIIGLISLLLLGLNLGSNEEPKPGECNDIGRNSVVALQILEYVNRDRVRIYCNGLVEELDIKFELIPVIGETYLVTIKGGQIVGMENQPGIPLQVEELKVMRNVSCVKIKNGKYVCNGVILFDDYLPNSLDEITYYEDGEVASWR
jgi:hypothetical protein